MKFKIHQPGVKSHSSSCVEVFDCREFSLSSYDSPYNHTIVHNFQDECPSYPRSAFPTLGLPKSNNNAYFLLSLSK